MRRTRVRRHIRHVRSGPTSVREHSRKIEGWAVRYTKKLMEAFENKTDAIDIAQKVKREGAHRVTVKPIYESKKKKIFGYAIFTSDVKAKDKYHVTTPPTQLFKTKTGARRYAKRRGYDDFKIMKY